MSQVNLFFICKAMYILVRGHHPVLIIKTIYTTKSVSPLRTSPLPILSCLDVTEDQTQLVHDRLKLNWTSKLQQLQ